MAPRHSSPSGFSARVDRATAERKAAERAEAERQSRTVRVESTRTDR